MNHQRSWPLARDVFQAFDVNFAKGRREGADKRVEDAAAAVIFPAGARPIPLAFGRLSLMALSVWLGVFALAGAAFAADDVDFVGWAEHGLHFGIIKLIPGAFAERAESKLADVGADQSND